MAKHKGSAYMTAGERIAGLIFFLIYLLVLPLVTGPMFDLIGNLLHTTIRPALRNLLYYYGLFAVTILIFHGFLLRTSRHPDRSHDVPGDDPTLVAALEDAHLDLRGLSGHSRAADDLNDL